jgi:heme/copper-type cytochrome/quinol oxidase subunit 1
LLISLLVAVTTMVAFFAWLLKLWKKALSLYVVDCYTQKAKTRQRWGLVEEVNQLAS